MEGIEGSDVGNRYGSTDDEDGVEGSDVGNLNGGWQASQSQLNTDDDGGDLDADDDEDVHEGTVVVVSGDIT